MKSFSSSYAMLENLCVTDPDQPVKYGLGKLAGALGIVGLAVALVWFALSMDMIDILLHSDNNTLMTIIGWFLLIIMAAIVLGCVGYGLYLGADGVTSLGKPFGIYSRDGSFYRRNGGYTNKPSVSDKKFGTKVTPVERVEDLAYFEEGEVLVNGIVINDADIHTETKTRMVPVTTWNGKTSTTTYIPQSYTEYTVKVKGELKGKTIHLYTVTEDGDFATTLANMDQGSAIYVRGSVDEDGDIDINSYGEAYKG